MLIHTFTTAAKRDAAAVDYANRWKKVLSIDLANGEDLRMKEFAADGTETDPTPVAFTNRFVLVAGEPKT